MDTIKVNKDELLSKLTENRTKHIDEFQLALKGYREDLETAYKIRLKALKNTDDANLVKLVQFTSLPIPQDHTKDYDRVIAMLNMSVDSIIDLDETEFRNYVQDEWSWSATLLTTNGSYASKYK